MTDWPKSACRSCDASIVWAISTASGKAMPIDATPDPEGNVTLTAGPDGKPRARVTGPPDPSLLDPDAMLRYVSHFATCPEAGQHRRR